MIFKLMTPIGVAVFSILTSLAGQGIEGSKHDFSEQGWSKNQICLPCHTPHATQPATIAPLWDRGPAATQAYKLYDNKTVNPGPGSLVCLSCHDGSTALDAYGGTTGQVFIDQVAPQTSIIGRNADLNGNHPVGVDYPDHNKGYRHKSAVQAEGDVPLPDGRVECISCHDVHNQSGREFLLVKSNNRSALCLSCHKK